MKKYSILTVIFLLYLCNTCLAQANSKPSPDMVRNQIRGGNVKEIYLTDEMYFDTIEFNKDGHEYLADVYPHLIYDAHDRLTYRMLYAEADLELEKFTYYLDTIIYESESDNRPLNTISGHNNGEKSVDFCDVKVKDCYNYKRFFYHGNECEPYASLEFSIVADDGVYCSYREYKYFKPDKYGNWREVAINLLNYFGVSEETIYTLCNPHLSHKDRQQIETNILERIKEIKDYSFSDDTEDSPGISYRREIIYY